MPKINIELFNITKLINAIANCPRISNEDKIIALDDIIKMMKDKEYYYRTIELFNYANPFESNIANTNSNTLCTCIFLWEDTIPGYDFWKKINEQLYQNE